MPGFSLIKLESDHKSNLLAMLAHYLGLQMGDGSKFKPGVSNVKAVMACIARIRKAEAEKPFSFSDEEFAIVYSAAQYMAADMMTPEGLAYMDNIFGDRRSKEFKKEMAEYFRDSCMYFVNECNEKFREIPDFANMRTQIEQRITSAKN